MNFIKNIFKQKKKVIFAIGILLLVLVFVIIKKPFSQAQAPQNITAQATKGTLINSISASGTISSGSNISITSNATGVVSQVYVKDGDAVSAGDKIAGITLDINSQQKQSAAWSSYLSAKNSLDSAQAKYNTLQAAAFKANQAFINDAVARTLAVDDPTYIQENDAWMQAESDYKNQAGVIAQSQVSLNSAWLSFVQLSPTITAPSSGTISGLTLTPGLPIASSTTAATFGTITLGQGSLQANVNLTEIDVVSVKPGQKVTLTLDAFADKTFTGVVSAVNTNGQVSSNVATYPTTITFDSVVNNIYPNMGVNATIITSIKNDVILVPTAAVQTTNGTSSVRVLKNNQVTSVPVEVGDSNDTQTEIKSGINEGDVVVTGTTATTSTGSSGGSSPFGSVGGGRGFGGGGGGGAAIRTSGR